MKFQPQTWIKTLVPLLAILVGGWFWLYHLQAAQARQEVLSRLQNISSAEMTQFDRWRRARIADAGQVMADAKFVDDLTRSPNKGANGKKHILARFAAFQAFFHYRDLLLTDTNGLVELSLSGQVGAVLGNRSADLATAFRNHAVVLTGLHPNSTGEGLTTEVVTPLFDATNQPVCAVLFQVSGGEYLSLGGRPSASFSLSGENVFVRQEGKFVRVLKQPNSGDAALTSVMLPLSRTNLVEVQAVLGKRGPAEGSDYRGKSVLAVLEPLPDPSWFMVTKLDVAEALGTWRLRAYGMVTGVVLIVALLLAAARIIRLQQDKVADLARLTESLQLSEQRVREEQNLFHTFMDHSTDRIYFKNLDGRFLRVSRTKLRRHGLKEMSQIIGKTDFDLDPGEQATLSRLEELKIIRTGEPSIGREESWQNPDGSTYWTSSSKAPLRDPNGKIIGIFGISRDITDQKRAEADKEKLAAENLLLHKSESLRRMAGAIAHHYNNQLQAVALGLGMVAEDLAKNDLPRETLDQFTEVSEAIKKLMALGQSMLTYLGHDRLDQTELDVAAVCLKTLPLLPAPLLKDLAVQSEFPAAGPVVVGNEGQLQQMLTSLITNAAEAMAAHSGKISLTLNTLAATDLPKVNRFPVDFQSPAQTFACLAVADEGTGIASRDIENLFDPFYTSKFTGRGLGLPVTLGIIKAHGGAIAVESCVGRGSVFRVFLPTAR